MAQKTVVIQLSRAAGSLLREQLAAEPFEFRSVPHAAFSAKGGGVVVTLYQSGKLVVQGGEPDLFLARYVDASALAQKVSKVSKASSPKGSGRGSGRGSGKGSGATASSEVTVGSDETGKGDYFGPLVVCGVRLDPELSAILQAGTGGAIRDSKELSDVEALQVGALLRERVPFAIARLDPPEYNATHARVKNLNPMLADLHAQVIEQLCAPGMRVVVDKFANEKLLVERTKGLDIRLEQRPRAESELAVACASILARQEFLAALSELSSEYGMQLRKGAGAPTEQAAREFVKRFGAAQLERVAKVHFKTTQKIGAGS